MAKITSTLSLMSSAARRGSCSPALYAAGARRGQARAPAAAGGSVPQTLRHLSAVLREFLHHRFLQRDVLLSAPVFSGPHVQLVGELLARGEAGIEVEELEQVYDRGPVVAAAAALLLREI